MPSKIDQPEGVATPSWRRRLLWLGVVVGAVFVGMQLVPYGWRHPNPPVLRDAPWPDAESSRIARQSCHACHSNETDWPAYSYVAPMSWLVRNDVERGRDEFNFSDWDEYGNDADDAIEMVEEDRMPPDRYTAIHRSARLSSDERERLIVALRQLDEDD